MFDTILFWVLAIATLIGGLAAIDYFRDKQKQKRERKQKLKPNPAPKPGVPLENPEGTVALDSPFYVKRPPIESDCYKEIV